MSSAVRPVHAIGKVAVAAIAVAAGVDVITVVLAWSLYYYQAYEITDYLSLLARVAAGVAFIAWMHRARVNADAITSKHQARYTGMWVFLGWFIPFANLFIPYAVMQDIWRGSDRTRPMTGLRQRPQSGLVKAWWLTYVASNVLAFVAGMSAAQDVAVVITISVLLVVAAAVLAARMIRAVNDMQVSVPTASPEPAA